MSQYSGKCTCGAVQYTMHDKPMFVHCCHCTWCQRESGSAFALNAMIEASKFSVQGEIESIDTPSNSGRGQKINRCARCKVALWSNYAGAADAVHFVKVGTLQAGHDIAPDIHIFTSSKQPWVVLPQDTPAVPEYYNPAQYWPQESRDRYKANLQNVIAAER
ncbi:GFA family protein [Massilia sp. W12]|uniref:GFA family protein n=1 Tax=Massilia sp. W12 TaxID=3126507 RepID=UPI0030D17B26